MGFAACYRVFGLLTYLLSMECRQQQRRPAPQRLLEARRTARCALPSASQANCGSCWAFAAAGAMEGAWFRATGRRLPLSQQHILDCSWGYRPGQPASNLACDGGDPDAAIGYIASSGGIAALADYSYRGADGLCRANATRRAARFKVGRGRRDGGEGGAGRQGTWLGATNVLHARRIRSLPCPSIDAPQGYARVPRYDEAALREALYSRGALGAGPGAGHAGLCATLLRRQGRRRSGGCRSAPACCPPISRPPCRPAGHLLRRLPPLLPLLLVGSVLRY